MAQAKFWKRQSALTEIEKIVANAFIEIENSSTEFKNDLKDIFLSSVQEFEVNKQGKQVKKAILIFVPFVCVKLLAKVHKKLVLELEKRLKATVLITAKRTIQSKWVKTHKSQQRPRSRALSTVYDALLDDLCLPSSILGKRTRVRVDGSQFLRIYLDQNERDILEEKLDAITLIYKKLTTRDIQFEFKQDQSFYVIKK